MSYLNISSSLKAFSNSTNVSSISEPSCHQFKVIMLGDVSVGKTAIVKRFVDNEFQSSYHCTVGVEYKIKSFKLDTTTTVNLKIWDTCGEEKYRTITRQYYRGSHGIVLVFDLTNKNSFDKLYGWLNDIKEYGPKDACVMLVGNKTDVKERKKFLFEEGKKFGLANKMPYIETSAKTGSNVVSLFESLTRRMIDMEKYIKKGDDEVDDSGKVVLDKDMLKGTGTIKIKQDDSGCC